MDAVLLHVLLKGFGWGGLYETSGDFEPNGTPPPGSAATAVGQQSGCLVDGCSHLQTSPYLPTAVGVALGVLSEALAGASSASVYPVPNATNRSGAMPGGLPGTISYPSVLAFRIGAAPSTATSTATITPPVTSDDRHEAAARHGDAVDDAAVRYLLLSLAPFEQSFTPPDGPCASYTTHTSPDRGGSPAAWVTTTAPVNSATQACAGAVRLAPYSLTSVV